MFKAMQKAKKQEGFTLIELLIVVAIIGILAAIAIPGYIGMQERGRKGSVIRTASAAEAELQGWLSAALKSGPGASLTEVDTNYDGVINSSDKSNSELNSAGVAATYVSARSSEKSPWDSSTTLWPSGGSFDSTGSCSNDGQITVAQSGNQISITACDNDGNLLHHKVISAD